MIDQDVFDRMVSHIRNNTTDLSDGDLAVPAYQFTDDAYAATEREVLKKQFLVVAVSSELPEANSFITRDLFGTALLIVRRKDRTIATYRNMCRHRGGKVELAESGRRPSFTCSYHGWSYGNDGSLRGVPYAEMYDPIDSACKGLFPIHSEERHGLIWVDLSNDTARSVADFLGMEADTQFARFRMDEAIALFERKYTLPINWKLVMDGAYDVLHPQFLHPNGVGKIVHTGACVWKNFGRHGQMFTARRRLADTVKAGELPEDNWRYFAGTFITYPNMMVHPTPDHYEFWTVWPSPTSASESHIHLRWMIDPRKLDEAGKIQSRVQRSLEIVEEAAMNEDWPMEETIQANAASNPDAEFIYGRGELTCQHLHRELARDMANQPELLRAAE